MTTILILQNNQYTYLGIADALRTMITGVDCTDHPAMDVDCLVVDNTAYDISQIMYAPIICMPSRCTPATVQDALSKGASGFVKHGEPTHVLAETVRAAIVGERTLTRERWQGLLSTIADERHLALAPYKLAPREEETLTLMADGYSNEAIASNMGIQVGTIRGYQRVLYDKLRVRNRHEAILLMVRLGII